MTVTAAHERELADLWASFDDLSEPEFVRRIDALAAQLDATGDDDARAVAAFERAAARDSTGQPEAAATLYREALGLGLTGIRRRRAHIQLASSLRNLGQAEEALALLAAERQQPSDELDGALDGFTALVLSSLGRDREALALALGALAPLLPRYQRSLAAYAAELVEPPERAEPPEATESPEPPEPPESPD